MDCARIEEMLPAYVAGDLSSEEAGAVEGHLFCCAACREELEGYPAVLGILANEPFLTPTPAESAALATAILQISVPNRAPSPRGLAGFALASLAVFATMITVLILQVFGRIAPLRMPGPEEMAKLAVAFVIVIIVTSFVPIAVTAKRRPLNGLTFSR